MIYSLWISKQYYVNVNVLALTITLCLYKSVSFLENTHKYLGAKKSIMSTNYSQTAQERIYTDREKRLRLMQKMLTIRELG